MMASATVDLGEVCVWVVKRLGGTCQYERRPQVYMGLTMRHFVTGSGAKYGVRLGRADMRFAFKRIISIVLAVTKDKDFPFSDNTFVCSYCSQPLNFALSSRLFPFVL